MSAPKKPWSCRLGFHSIFADTVGTNHGTETVPIFFMDTTHRCNFCDWSDK